MKTKQTIFNEAKAAGFEAWIILWLGTDEWELFYGTLDKARERVMGDRAYSNYGHKGAVILPLTEPAFEIRPGWVNGGWLEDIFLK